MSRGTSQHSRGRRNSPREPVINLKSAVWRSTSTPLHSIPHSKRRPRTRDEETYFCAPRLSLSDSLLCLTSVPLTHDTRALPRMSDTPQPQPTNRQTTPPVVNTCRYYTVRASECGAGVESTNHSPTSSHGRCASLPTSPLPARPTALRSLRTPCPVTMLAFGNDRLQNRMPQKT